MSPKARSGSNRGTRSKAGENPGTPAAAGAEQAGLGKLDNYIGFHLRLAQNASFKAFKKKTGEDNLRPGWFAVLSLIHDNPGITPMALSRASGRDKSTLTPVLRDLDKRHFIARQPTANDRRSYSLFLTPAGQAKLARLAGHAADHDKVLDDIVGENKADLIDLLRRIWSVLDE